MDFRNTVIVMTSNLGSDVIQSMSTSESTSDYEAIKAAVMESVTAHFRPEFVNRIDEVVVFHALGASQIQGIAKIQLSILEERLQEQGIHIEFDEAAMSQLAEAGFDPVYGARPLKRAIQKRVENPLAQNLLSGDFVAGDVIVASIDGDELRFAKKELH